MCVAGMSIEKAVIPPGAFAVSGAASPEGAFSHRASLFSTRPNGSAGHALARAVSCSLIESQAWALLSTIGHFVSARQADYAERFGSGSAKKRLGLIAEATGLDQLAEGRVGPGPLGEMGSRMIDPSEIREIVSETGLNPYVVEKDYVIGWVLAGIYMHPLLSQLISGEPKF